MNPVLVRRASTTVGLIFLLAVFLPQGLRASTKHKRQVPLGIDFMCSHQVCVAFSANLEAGDFFRGLRSRKTSHGMEFRKGSTPVTMFPDKVSVTILATIGECDESHKCDEGSGFRFDADFMKSLHFKGFWKRGFETNAADVIVLGAESTPNPTPVARAADWWRYELEVRSSNVGLDESIVIEVESPDGQVVTRFASRL
jgi:hypothetical protein